MSIQVDTPNLRNCDEKFLLISGHLSVDTNPDSFCRIEESEIGQRTPQESEDISDESGRIQATLAICYRSRVLHKRTKFGRVATWHCFNWSSIALPVDCVEMSRQFGTISSSVF